jgi:hypothetical protein
MILLKILIFVIGGIVFFGGILLVNRPELIIRLNENIERMFKSFKTQKVVYTADDQVFSSRYLFGALFILIGLYILFSGLQIK